MVLKNTSAKEQKEDLDKDLERRAVEALLVIDKIRQLVCGAFYLPVAFLNTFRMLCSKDSNDAFGNR